MNKLFKKLMFLFMTLVMVFTTVSCGVEATSSISIGFKSNGQAGDYNESIEEFLIGKPFYSAIRVTVETNKKDPIPYTVKVELPKTKDVTVEAIGGNEAYEVVEDTENGLTKLSYNVNGKKGAQPELIKLRGVPYQEGSCKITVKVFDKKSGEQVGSTYFMTVYFLYELN